MIIKRNYSGSGSDCTTQTSRVIPGSQEVALIVHLKCIKVMNINALELYAVKRGATAKGCEQDKDASGMITETGAGPIHTRESTTSD